MDLDTAFDELRRERQSVLDEASEQAQSILSEARAQADALREDAARVRAVAYEEGHRAGMESALAQWHSRAVQSDEEFRLVRRRMRERLAELVTQAVERIVVTEDARTLFERALDSIDRISERATYLTVSVSAADYAQASEVFERFVHDWSVRGRTIKLTVRADKRLAEGSCLCESDFGVVDASLDTQIRALRAAAERALGADVASANSGGAAAGSLSAAGEHSGDSNEAGEQCESDVAREAVLCNDFDLDGDKPFDEGGEAGGPDSRSFEEGNRYGE